MTTEKEAIVQKLQMQSIKAVLDVLLLAELKNGSMSGYDAIGYLHNKFGVLLSSGTIYAHLYALERDGLITSDFDLKKRVFELTEKGEQTLAKVSKGNVELLNSLKTTLKQ